MANIKFFYNNLWKDYTITKTTQHENFPAENTQHRDFNKAWHSQHRAGSGWGYFYIEAAVNDRLDFEDSGAVTRAALLTPGVYNADTLASHIETQMEAVTADDLTVEYIESGASINKFRITNNTGNFKLLWNSGANKARSIADTVGYDDTGDDTGEAIYTANEIRIHSFEWLRENLGSAQDIYGVMIRGHNFQAGASVYIQISDDNWTSVAEQQLLTIQDDILVYEWDAAKNYQYVGIMIYDVDNSNGHVKAGVLFIGPQFQPVTNNLQGSDLEDIDPSIVMESEAGQESSLQGDQYEIGTYVFRVNGAAEVANFKAMRDAVGTSKALFVCEDPTSDATARATTKYIRFTSWKWIPIKQSVDRWQLILGYKEQR